MFLDKDLSDINDDFLRILRDPIRLPINYGLSEDELDFYLWELKLLDIFLGLQSFPFIAGDCGLHDFPLKMVEYFKALCAHAAVFPDPNLYPRVSLFALGIWKTKQKFRANYSLPIISSVSLPANKDDGVPTPDFVTEFIDIVEKYFNIIVQTDDPSSFYFVPGTKDQIQEALKELKLLRFFVLFVSKECIEPQSRHTFFTHVLIEASHIAMVAWLCLPSLGNKSQDSDPGGMNALLSDLLKIKIKPIRKIYIDVLRALKPTIQPAKHSSIRNKLEACKLPAFSNPTGVASLNDQMTVLQEMIHLLRASLIHLPVQDLEFYLQDTDTLIVDAGLLIYSLYDINGEKEGTTLEDVNRALGLDLPSNIQPIKAMIYLIMQMAFQTNLPRIHGLGNVDFLLNNMKEYQARYPDSLASVMNQLLIIQKVLESAQPFLKDVVEERHNKHEGLQHWATLLSGKAYEVEYVVDACNRKEVPQWILERWLLDIIEEITLIRTEVVIQKMKMLHLVPHDTMNTATAQIPSRLAKTPRMIEGIVGFEEVRKELREKLIKGSRQLDVISIVGMPGIGKTTVAEQLYSDESIVEHFDIRAQCCVSQVYKRMDLLLTILHDAIGVRPSISSEADAADELRKILMVKRFLILIDDVWETGAWDDLKCCFHDANNGSRIIITTRHIEVANHAISVSNPIPLRMFNDDESWKLLEDKVFGKESCSPPLEEVGKQIAKKCGGLPLSIVLVAGILAKMEKTEESWQQVAMTLGSQILSDSKAVVEQSYQDLPCHLKPCFLYLGAFLEDREIDASKLTRLWISEAFIKTSEVKSLEDIAEGYLENLIGRNLVMVSERAYLDGKVQACRIHDVLLDFCKKRAAEEKFLLWIKRDQNVQNVNPSYHIYSRKQHAPYRLACFEVNKLKEWSSSCSLVGSVLLRAHTVYPEYITSYNLCKFKFLKVLDLEHCHVAIDSFPINLVHLRYFSFKTFKRSLPSSISNLWNLETLIVNGEEGYILPITVWKMVKLRNLHITFSPRFLIENGEELHPDSSKLHDLRTLSTPCFSCVNDAELLLRKTPNLQELKFKFTGVSSGQFPVLHFPTWLETLHIFPEVSSRMFPVCISATNLKDLRIASFQMNIQHLINIAQLQNLQALELRSIVFDDEKWEVSDDEFPQLRVLKLIYCSSLKEWTVSDDAFPNLECLELERCENLEEIPSCFGDISSLKSIEVYYCNESVKKSARDIAETQVEDYQNNYFKLLTYEL